MSTSFPNRGLKNPSERRPGARGPNAGGTPYQQFQTGAKVRWKLAVLALITLGIPAFAGQPKVGGSLPDLAQFEYDGKIPADLHGKVVLVDFWASWCGPCQASFPVMEDLQKKYGTRGLVIVAVSMDEKKSVMDKFLARHPVSFSVVRDAKHKLAAAVDIASMPTSFILDGDGKIRSVHNGFKGESTRKEYEREIEELLNPPAQK